MAPMSLHSHPCQNAGGLSEWLRRSGPRPALHHHPCSRGPAWQPPNCFCLLGGPGRPQSSLESGLSKIQFSLKPVPHPRLHLFILRIKSQLPKARDSYFSSTPVWGGPFRHTVLRLLPWLPVPRPPRACDTHLLHCIPILTQFVAGAFLPLGSPFYDTQTPNRLKRLVTLPSCLTYSKLKGETVHTVHRGSSYLSVSH